MLCVQLVYAGSEAFQVDAVKRRADVHSQVIKADKEKVPTSEGYDNCMHVVYL